MCHYKAAILVHEKIIWTLLLQNWTGKNPEIVSRMSSDSYTVKSTIKLDLRDTILRFLISYLTTNWVFSPARRRNTTPSLYKLTHPSLICFTVCQAVRWFLLRRRKFSWDRRRRRSCWRKQMVWILTWSWLKFGQEKVYDSEKLSVHCV